MSEIVDRVKQAFQRQFETELSDGNVGAEELARAAIEALREPTEAMTDDLYSAGYDPNFGYFRDGREVTLEDLWRAMIDAALRE